MRCINCCTTLVAVFSVACSDGGSKDSGEGSDTSASTGNSASQTSSGTQTSSTSAGSPTGASNGTTGSGTNGNSATGTGGSQGSTSNNTSSNTSAGDTGGGGGDDASGASTSTGGASPDNGPPPNVSTETLPPGSTLPNDDECAQMIRRSSWEPRPENDTANHTVPTNLDLAPWGDARIDAMVDRVTGNFTGTTDEILQWGACKWGFDAQTVRAQAVIESYWQMDAQGDINYNGDCHPSFPDMGDGCPQSFGILQVRFTSVETFNSATPEVAEMTALNVELTLLTRRACFEGYFEWLNDVEGRGDYAAGDQWGCMGAWFAGRWYTDDASYYIDRVRNELENEQSWLSSDF